MAVTLRIAAVPYLDAAPFLYGIRHEGSLRAEFLLSSPADCYRCFVEGRADIALLPASVVPGLKSAEMISDYCIASSDGIRTVALMSNTPIEEVRRIWLDTDACASVQLTGYLARERWKIGPEWLSLTDGSLLDAPQAGDAFLLVGERVADHADEFIYTCDLAAEWYEQTRLPFPFAVWVARKGTPYEVSDALQRALTFGVERIYEAVMERDCSDRVGAYDYLTRSIDYLFDHEKHTALQKFWNSGVKVTPRANPG